MIYSTLTSHEFSSEYINGYPTKDVKGNIFVGTSVNECKKIRDSFPLTNVIIITEDDMMEYDFIRCLNMIEVNRYIEAPSIPTTKTYLIRGKRGLRYLPYHIYLKGWTFLKGPKGIIDLYLFIKDGSFKPDFKIKSVLATKCDNIESFTNKHSLYDIVPEFMAKKFKLGDLEVEYPIILKPTGKGAFSGHGIHVVSNKSEYTKTLALIKHNTSFTYGAYEYVKNPMLFNDLKFHLRVYYVVSTWGRCEVYPFYRILTAKLPYQKGDYSNTDIHDTHVGSTKDDYFCPTHFVSHKANKQIVKLTNKLSTLIKPKPYPEAQHAYEIIALDIMIRDNEDIVLLEINDSPGLNLIHKNKDLWYQSKLIELELSFIRDVYDVKFKDFKDASQDDLKSLEKITSLPMMKKIGHGKPWTYQDLLEHKKNDEEDSKNKPYIEREYCQWLVYNATGIVGYLGLRPIKGEVGHQVRIFCYPTGRGYGKLVIAKLLKVFKGRIWSIVEEDNIASNKLFNDWTMTKRKYSGSTHNFYFIDNRYVILTNVPQERRTRYNSLYILVSQKHLDQVDFVIQVGKPNVKVFNGIKNIIINESDEVLYEDMLAVVVSSIDSAFSYVNMPMLEHHSSYNTYFVGGTNELKKHHLHVKLRFWSLSNNGLYVRNEAGSKHMDKCYLKNGVCNIDNFINKDMLRDVMKEHMPKTYTIHELNQIDFSNPHIVKPVGPGAFKGRGIQVVTNHKELKLAIDAIKKHPKWRVTIQEYIRDPILFKNLKFQARVHVMVSTWGCYLFPNHEIITAKTPYKDNDYTNKDIHDTHGATTPLDYTIKNDMPELYDELHGQIKGIFKTLRDRIKPKAYDESIFGYEMLGLDIMFTKSRAYLLEVNNKVGQRAAVNKTRDAWDKQILEWEYECIKTHLP